MLSKNSLADEQRLPVRRPAGADDELVEIDAEPLADLLLELPGAVLAAAAQVDDGAHALGLEAGDLMRGRLGRAPQPVGDLVLVQVDRRKTPWSASSMLAQARTRPGSPSTGRSQRAMRAMRRA